uniref:Ig-like domain-containing protein n=1 Tax=Peromyscus maniculatus bairdii TaxID=230844 RepID=A0A8C8UNI8_PERMB
CSLLLLLLLLLLHLLSSSFSLFPSLSLRWMEQIPKLLSVLEGENFVLHCNYTVSPAGNLRWYRQDTGRGLVSLAVMTYTENKKSNGRYSASLDADAKHSTLHITASQLEDTASYICVVGAPCSTDTCSQTQNLSWRLQEGRGDRTVFLTLY